MVLVVKEKENQTECWACGLEIGKEESYIVAIGANRIASMHLECAQSIGRGLLGDLADCRQIGIINEIITD